MVAPRALELLLVASVSVLAVVPTLKVFMLLLWNRFVPGMRLGLCTELKTRVLLLLGSSAHGAGFGPACLSRDPGLEFSSGDPGLDTRWLLPLWWLRCRPLLPPATLEVTGFDDRGDGTAEAP